MMGPKALPMATSVMPTEIATERILGGDKSIMIVLRVTAVVKSEVPRKYIMIIHNQKKTNLNNKREQMEAIKLPMMTLLIMPTF